MISLSRSPGGHPLIWLVALGISAAIVISVGFSTGRTQAQSGYVGPERCRACHGRLSDAWSRTPHSLTAKPRNLPPELLGCEACHGPGALHASSMDRTKIVNPARLPPTGVNAVCGRCHVKGAHARVPDAWSNLEGDVWRRTAHQKKGVSCLACHTGHQASTRLPAGELCASCHDELLGGKGRFAHLPVAQQQCTLCHDPHGTSRRYGLSRDLSATCKQCHDVTTKGSLTAHRGYDVRNSDCTSCHTPHGRNVEAKLIKPVQHAPFGRRQCAACHIKGSAALVKPPPQLCYSCHDQARVIIPQEPVVHLPVARGVCTGCHAAHASTERGLLKDKVSYTCLACHRSVEDEMLRPVAHRPADDGACLTCHRPHTSAQRSLLTAEPVALCASCHGRHARFTHPLGDKARDPAGNPITCSTCHEPHGSSFKYLGRADPRRDLCLRCHRLSK